MLRKCGFVAVGVAIASWTVSAGLSNAATSSPVVEVPSNQTAQFYPTATDDQQVLMVVGQGQVTRAADKAEITLVLLNYDITSYTYAEASEGRPPAPSEPTSITPAALKPVLDALNTAGVTAGTISVISGDQPTPAAPYNYYGKGSAAIRFDLDQPSSDRISQVMAAAGTAATANNLYLQDRYVTYTTNSCADLETEAFGTALADARDRAQVIAAAMGVELSNTPSVAQSAGLAAVNPYNPYPSPCDLQALPAAAAAYVSPTYYDPSLPAEVTLQRDLYVTYPIQRR